MILKEVYVFLAAHPGRNMISNFTCMYTHARARNFQQPSRHRTQDLLQELVLLEW